MCECDWKKADPKQLAETIRQLKHDIQEVRKSINDLKKMRYDITELLHWKNSQPSPTTKEIFKDDDISF